MKMKTPVKKKTKVIIGRIVSIKVTEERMSEIENKVHAEFTKVPIPQKKQLALKCGDTIYDIESNRLVTKINFLF